MNGAEVKHGMSNDVYFKAKAEGVAIPFVALVTRRELVPFS